MAAVTARLNRRRVAVLGTGSVGMRHLRILRTIGGVEPVAIPARASRRAALEKDGYLTAAGLIEAAALGARACVVATDTGRHLSDGLAALSCGMDLLMEKPLAPRALEARRLIAAAKKARRRIFVGCVLRFAPSLNRFRSLLPKIGRIHSVQIECRSYLPDWRPGRPYRDGYSARAAEGGVLRDLIHEIDYAGWLYGWPRKVSGRALNLGRLGIASEEIAEASWVTSGRCSVTVGLDYLTRPTRRRMTAAGERGTLEWDGVSGAIVLTMPAKAPIRLAVKDDRDGWYRAQAKAFLAAARGGARGNLATGEDGVRALLICDEVRRS
jgi:predicted dehydrogenase